MIASLTGRLRRKAADYLIIDVSGVGYQVYVPLSTFYGLPDEGEETSLFIYTHVREDFLGLFGFLTQPEKDAFLLLMDVSGIGPKLALTVLSGMSVDDLTCAIQSSDDAKLCGIPGIGKKTAARMVLELKDKMKQFAPLVASRGEALRSGTRGNSEDAVSALVNLGYKNPLAEEAVKRVLRDRPDMRLEAIIREALGELGKR